MPILSWYGHACFKLDFGAGGSVVFDPYEFGCVPGAEMPDGVTADMVLCSHDHHDHNAAGRVSLSGNAPAFTVTAVDTYHDPEQGALRGTNRISMVEYGGFRAVHLGDLGCALTAEQIEILKGADLLLIPVGGHFTIGPEEAKRVMDQLMPRLTVPMHYRRGEMGFPIIAALEDFTGLFESCTELPGSSLEIGPETRGLCVMNL